MGLHARLRSPEIRDRSFRRAATSKTGDRALKIPSCLASRGRRAGQNGQGERASEDRP
jgi:hypothetical protein